MPAHNGSPVANNRSDPVDEDQDAGKMPAPGNAALVRQAIEQIWNQGNLDVADTLFTAAYVNVVILRKVPFRLDATKSV